MSIVKWKAKVVKQGKGKQEQFHVHVPKVYIKNGLIPEDAELNIAVREVSGNGAKAKKEL